MKHYSTFFILLFFVSLLSFALPSSVDRDAEEKGSTYVTPEVTKSKRIFLALLLDTSNSMDGLIDQAKSQLWNIVDELANATYDEQPAELHLALYEYGNDGLSVRSDYIRQVSAFTEDLDEISSLLFALSTNGGSEYCGAVIGSALDNLGWSDHPGDLQMIFIAGNEPFDQGSVSYKSVCSLAREKDIQVNTIFCGDYQEGIRTYWKNGADLGNGKYMNIDMDQKTIYVSTPYDDQIDKLNDKLNDTYIAYGKRGAEKKQMQLQEDSNAGSYSQMNKVRRTISKSKHIYKNESWDLVDASKEETFKLAEVKEEDLPQEMKTMSVEERKAYIAQKGRERAALQKDIQALGAKRAQYTKHVNDSLANKNELESAIIQSIKEVAEKKSFVFKEE